MKISIITCLIIVISISFYYLNKEGIISEILSVKSDHQSEQTIKCSNICSDANCDGKVDDKDLDYLNKYLAEWEEYTLTEEGRINADVYADGEINGKDATVLSGYLEKISADETLPYIQQ